MSVRLHHGGPQGAKPKAEVGVLTIPTLAIVASNATNAIVSWTPPTFGLLLQDRTNLTTGNWSNASSGELNPVTWTLPKPGSSTG